MTGTTRKKLDLSKTQFDHLGQPYVRKRRGAIVSKDTGELIDFAEWSVVKNCLMPDERYTHVWSLVPVHIDES